MKVILKPL